MPKHNELGSIAAQVFEYGDLEALPNGNTHYQMLAAYEAIEKHQVREATRLFVGQLKLERDRLAEKLSERAISRSRAVDAHSDRIAVVEQWRAKGIRERMTLRSIPRTGKWFLWALICSLDFYIFAQVMAYAENIADPGLTDATFWLGGAVGVMVFIVGILLAQALRRASYYHAQKKLLRELKNAGEETTGLRLSSYSRWMTLFFGLFYIFFTAGAVVLRYQGGGKEQPGLLLLQTMIPIVGVMLELLIHDPSEVRLPQRTMIDWWLSRKIAKFDVRIALRQLIVDERQAAISARFAFERSALQNLHESRGIISSVEARGFSHDDDFKTNEITPTLAAAAQSFDREFLPGAEHVAMAGDSHHHWGSPVPSSTVDAEVRSESISDEVLETSNGHNVVTESSLTSQAEY